VATAEVLDQILLPRLAKREPVDSEASLKVGKLCAIATESYASNLQKPSVGLEPPTPSLPWRWSVPS
jgi:hypothetical protein